jgi:acetate kinase
MSDEKDCIDAKIDIGVLKTQVAMLTQLCDKMDKVIEKIVDQQDRMVNQIYTDMEKRKTDTNTDIKELHSRITTVDRSLSDKLELTERRIMEKIEALQAQIAEHNKKEDSDLKKILEWKWMAAGGIIVLAWVVSNVNLASLSKLFA